MLSQVLYDKEISVTLYRNIESAVPSYQVSTIQGYREDVIQNKKVLSTTVGTSLKTTALGDEYPTTVSLEFYEGNVRRIFAGYKRKADGTEYAIYKKIKATGNLYKLDTLEQMKEGMRPDGNPFKTGDRVRVSEDGSLWNVVVSTGHLDNSVDGTTTEEEEAEVLYLNCTNEGLKPDMSFTVSLLPGQNCYNAVLKVRNLNLASTNIRSWSRMVVEAGYRTGPKARYTCPIFASYIEEPNPDGITVFEGITVGTADGILNNRYTEIRFLQEKIPLIELVEHIAKGISPNITVECAISDDIMKQEINVKKQTVYAQNGVAILSWLQTTISQFIQNISTQQGKTPISAFVQLNGNELLIIALNGPNKVPVRKESIINLDMITGATFNGTALTVVAPWNPGLQPGGLFYMPPEFINGSKLPNVLPIEDYRNEDNLYRALTMSVSFASVENVNKMEILAVPAQYAGELPTGKATFMRGDLLARALSKDVAYSKAIDVGATDKRELSEVNNIKDEDRTNKKMFDEESGLLAAWGAWTPLEVTADKGTCLSTILDYYFFQDPNGPRLLKGLKGENNEGSYYRDKDALTKDGLIKAADHIQNNGCSANHLWWPLVMVGTYWRWVAEGRNNKNNSWSEVDPKNPDLIKQNYYLYIPVWSSSWTSMLSKMKLIKDVWRYAYIEYKNKYPDICNVWRAMYYYMGGTDDIG